MKGRNTVKASQGVMTKPVKQNHIEHNEFIDALTGLNHFVWDLAELAMEAAKLPSKVFSFKLLKNTNVLIFDATVFIARELSAGKDINVVFSCLIPSRWYRTGLRCSRRRHSIILSWHCATPGG